MKSLQIAIVSSLMLGAPFVAGAQSGSGTNDNGTSESATQCRDADGKVHMKSAMTGQKDAAKTGSDVGAASGTKSGGTASHTTATGSSHSKTTGKVSDLAPC